MYGQIEFAKWLVVEMKQDIAQKDKKGFMPVHYATYFGFTKFVDLVMRAYNIKGKNLD